MSRLGRPVEAVEIDPRSVGRLGRVVPGNVTVTRGDVRRWAREHRVGPNALPRDLDAHAWVGAYRLSVG
jgi:hypothetical protein